MIYPNIKQTADEVVADFKDFENGTQRFYSSFKIGNVIGKTQSGKTLLQQQIASLLDPHFIFGCTTYSNVEIVDQYENDMRGYPNVVPFRISTIMSEANPHPYERLQKDIRKSMEFGNVLFLMFDESEFRIGENSILDKFIRRVSNDFPNLRIYTLFIGATPMSLRALEADLQVPLKSFLLEPGNGYVGLEEYLESGNVFDTSHIKPKQEKLLPHKDVLEKLDEKIEEFGTGLFMLRARGRTAKQADNWKNSISNRYSSYIADGSLEVITAHTDNLTSIKQSIMQAERECRYQRVILIVVGGLSAGYRLFSTPDMKKHIHFVYEPSTKNMTSAQGLSGRATGYYTPEGSGPTICMREEAINEYSTLFDMDNIIQPSPNASTHTSGAVTRIKKFTPCKVLEDFVIDVNLSANQIMNSLGYDKSNTRYSTSDFWNFDGQWKNSEENEPNYNIISYTYGEVKEFTILIDKINSVARVVQKDGIEQKVVENYHNSVHKNTSMFSKNPYSKFNKESK